MSLEGQFIQGHRVLKQIDIIRLNKDEIVFTVTFGKATPYEFKITKHKIEVPILRIDVQVHGGDDNAKFVFWNNTCIELLGITADYPLLLDEMMG
ncbi:hypothetical protein QL285_097179 [Trifolium repens]|nr:hypothetical protein QL285_097179 [Trifolium repens]